MWTTDSNKKGQYIGTHIRILNTSAVTYDRAVLLAGTSKIEQRKQNDGISIASDDYRSKVADNGSHLLDQSQLADNRDRDCISDHNIYKTRAPAKNKPLKCDLYIVSSSVAFQRK